jgi:hypothetical protein
MGCTNLTSKRKHISIIKKPTNSTGGSVHSSNEQIGVEKSKSQSDSEVQFIPKNSIHIELYPNTVGKMLELCVEKGSKLKFHVNGKWSIYEDQPLVGHKGYTNIPQYRGINIAALIGHIPGGKIFKVVDGCEVVADSTGPLYLYPNDRNENSYSNGFLNVYIGNAIPMSYEAIELKLGWDKRLLIEENDSLSQVEYDVLLLLNKLRSNPRNFAIQYITHIISEKKNYQELYDKLTSNNPSKLIKHSIELSEIAKSTALTLGQSGLIGNKCAHEHKAYEVVTESIVYNIINPCNIILKLLLGQRDEVLNGFNQVGISIEKHITYNWISVLVLGA